MHVLGDSVLVHAALVLEALYGGRLHSWLGLTFVAMASGNDQVPAGNNNAFSAKSFLNGDQAKRDNDLYQELELSNYDRRLFCQRKVADYSVQRNP
ncbi:hypothetical protein BDBG_01963 [Blastomyces gilchristii SLH14081]|uniref:Uncharacterized protein n=1 Tax=Blastomyces gilchristii (strain SLH14081) TaxID=559298 RepID=A0A179UCA9_BLAGS|nr:uncharacterized protein BDBG_01963 [Blastomyces gilchristii SLH14081]OAT05594.1 hypothetical protein BDBG_01963 [Blastomyces gilchristii SLH14081]